MSGAWQTSVVLYRRSLALKSGAGQLLALQAAGLASTGTPVRVAGERGRTKFLFATGRFAHAMTVERARRLTHDGGCFVVDNQAAIPEAGVVFVHNLQAALAEVRPTAVAPKVLDEERWFFDRLGPQTLLV